jgi:putative membrane-bound dehydrogenase-like protein
MPVMRQLFMLSVLPFLSCAFSGDAPAAGLSPQDAARAMKVPDGFNVTLFAGEPDVVQPAAFEFDDRGRVWVAEFSSYPIWKPTGRDRILIFEDKDGDGKFDSVKVFWDKGNYLSGLALGQGGVWVCCAPNLLFIPIKDGEDAPAGEPKVVLDGWGTQGKHNVVNSLTWGPDGWLYGCSGITGPSRVGKPGTPDAERIPINCGVWRYHPTKKIFEAVLHGTTNPWGIDYDDWGQMFIINNVIGHLWHVIPGMHTERMFGEDYNKYTYGLLEQCADHIHWAGGSWQGSRGGKGPHDATGGGHSHCGEMIYLGDNWPDKYRNTIFMNNTHGNRINNDILRRQGSGYVAQHGKDLLFANDLFFRGTALKSGPDGAVIFSDWNQGGECHSGDLKTTGRIFKLAYGKTQLYSGDVAKLSDGELVALQLHKNDWFVRHARRVLQDRAAAGTLKPETVPALLKLYDSNPDVTRKLRALWALHAMGAAQPDFVARQLDHEDDNIRAWAVRLLTDFGEPAEAVLAKFEIMAQQDSSALVRLHLVSALQKFSLDKRLAILKTLASHEQDALDHNLPLMYWYALEPVVASEPNSAQATRVAGACKVPLLRRYTARRLTEMNTGAALPMLAAALSAEPSPAAQAAQADILNGMIEALKGRRNVAAPEQWKELGAKLNSSGSAEVRKLALKVAVVFGDTSAFEKYRALAGDAHAKLSDREGAVEALVTGRDEKAPTILQQLLDEPALRGAAMRGLAVFDHPNTAAAILKIYPSLVLAEKSDALYTLGSRPAYAMELLEALKNKSVPKEDLNAFTLRYLESSGVPELNKWIQTNWGGVKQSSAEIRDRIAKYKKVIEGAGPQAADIGRGHAVFKKTCFNCHTLFGEGGKVGPDLTGSGRANLDYLLLNVIDPNAIVASEYMVTIIKTKDGRMISGLVRNDRETTFDMITTNEVLTIAKNEVAARKMIQTSMMPEGILDTLSEAEVIDLVAFLQSSPANLK